MLKKDMIIRFVWFVLVVGLVLGSYSFAGPGKKKKAEVKASISGCRILPANNIWNTPVDTLPVDANSNTYINTIGANDNVHADFGSGLWDGGPIGIPFVTVPGSQPKVNVTFDYDDESDPGPYPVPADAPIEGGAGSDGDRHVLVLDRDNCILYELYYAYPQGDGSWTAGSGAIYDLKSNALRPAGWTSADAAGLPILPGLVRYDEVASGEIDHALRFTVPRTRKKYIWPARHYASSLTGSQYPPMGQRFRLKADFDISSFSSKVQVILRALKKYGMILADNGSEWFISGVPDERWNNDTLRELHDVKGSDFEAVDVSSLMISPNSGQAKQPGNAKTITVTSPNGGESWTGGSNKKITWTSTGSVGNVKIEYSTDNGSGWITVASSTANDGVYWWTLPSVSSTACLVRVSESGGSTSDTSDSTFSIVSVAPASITVTAPAGGENWTAGTTATVKWTSTGSVGNVKIQLLKGGSTVLTITSSTSNDGMYKWTLPGNLSGASNYKVKISDTTNGSIDDSGNNFTITAASSGQPEIALNRTRLNFGAIVSNPVTGKQKVLIGNSGAGLLNWTASGDKSWLSVTPSSGSGSGSIWVSANVNGLAAGSYSGQVNVSDGNAANSPQTVKVYLTVKPSGQDLPPFGSFDTPLQGASVRSSIPVTGWALDDLEVLNVWIYRETSQGLKFVGDGVFVEGARPDVENSNPSYPMNYRGGWGYMLLTNFLPGGGNGTVKLVAVARDIRGQLTTLGGKTISVDNANAVKPFGAIDTPVQGKTASGGRYVNFGWALTPQPNAIPTDGSTIDVYVDGVNIGHPVYNNYRKDIATLFPGYANSNGAIGYFYLDTTAYANGVHTIAWSVTDNAGNADGVGSRYFTIDNTGSRSMARTSWVNTPAAPEITGYTGPVAVKRGYDKNAQPELVYPDEKGVFHINIHELQRVEIHFFPMILKNELNIDFQTISPAPPGSSLDNKQGIFFWQPGPGFLGRHRFEFHAAFGERMALKKTVIIRITPGKD
jgi:hypothetical protein